MSSILDIIVGTKLDEIARRKELLPGPVLESRLDRAPAIRDFLTAVHGSQRIGLIAEVKKASPSRGVIRPDFDPVAIARSYAKGGAAALSVLTDEKYFQGSLEYLRQIRQAVKLPLLRKDFLLDEYQVLEARDAGADAVLLIAECLPDDRLPSMYDAARRLGMHALIEFYEESNLDRVLATGTPLVGVNNRDLHTFQVDLHHTLRMRTRIPKDRCLVGESGIHTNEDVRLLESAGVNAMLVGESLMRQPDITKAVRKLLQDT
jgi:indole-3-glycerol phosphate synthase